MLGDDASSDDRMGELFGGKYRVGRMLGHGLTGSVYLGRSVWNDALMSLKLLHPELARTRETLNHFLHVTGETSQLGHANIVSVFESGQDAEQGVAYVAMEHIGGRNLSQLIADDWPLEEPRVVDIVSQVLSALDLAHARGIVHGDLKSNNILFRARRGGASKAEQVVLCDFSVAQLAPFAGTTRERDSSDRALDTEAALLARAQYASPEQTQAEVLDARSDIYAVGVMLYRMLTRTLPFNADCARDLGLQHRLSVARPPSQLGCSNSALEAVCLKALSKTREARYQSAREMQSALAAALAQPGLARVSRPASLTTGSQLALRPQSAVEPRPIATARPVVEAPRIVGTGAGRPPASAQRDHSRAKSKGTSKGNAPRRTRVATLRIPRDPIRSHSLAPAERSSPVPSYRVPKRHSGPWLIVALVFSLAVWAGATRYSSFEGARDSETDDDVLSGPAAETPQVATAPAQEGTAALAAPPVFLPTAQHQPVAEAPSPAMVAHELPTQKPPMPSAVATVHAPTSLPARSAPKPQPTAAVIAHGEPMYASERLAAHARLAIGSIFTRAPVASADIRAAIDQDHVTDCYRAMLLVGTRLRSPLETRLDIETDGTGNITFAGVHLAQLPQDFRDCIEHVARTSRVSGSGAKRFAASITLTFDQH